MSARRMIANLWMMLLVLSLLLAGCVAAAPNAQSTQDGVTIKIMTWHGPDAVTKYYAGYKQITDDYSAKHPNVTFEFVYQPLDGYKELLDTQFVSGSAPDIIQMQPWMFGEYANKGVLYNLNNAFNAPSPYAHSSHLPRLPETLQRCREVCRPEGPLPQLQTDHHDPQERGRGGHSCA